MDRTVVRKANRTMMRKADGLPYIPGSTVKGRLRFFAERVLRSSSPPAGLSLHGSNQPHCKAVYSACTLCRLFGNPAIPALLQVGQASLIPRWDTLLQELLKTRHNPVLRPDVEIRPGIALSRSRRTALPDHLFFDEAVPAVTFSGRMLQQGLYVGGKRAARLGRIRLRDNPIVKGFESSQALWQAIMQGNDPHQPVTWKEEAEDAQA